ncbi:MAG: CU044_2847 family protein [Xenococcaceae cyanobacterium MO_188.B29]|nr:CU044_2847 family protein [Xenococcaceae cyanobacterium MO_188.B29]
MESRTRIIPVKVNNDITVMVEAKDLGGEQDVATLSFQQVTDTIEAVTEAIATSINKVKPDKATVEIGFDITVKSGKLTTLIVEGSGKANLKLTLQCGAPLLNKRTGKICGLIKRSRDIHTSLGGRGVPVSIIFEHFPELKPNVIPHNPFNYLTGRIDDPQLVFGREKEVNRIFEILNCGSSVAIIGEAEIGKSSLLRLIEYQTKSKLNSPHQPIYLNLGNVYDEEDFYFALCDRVGIPVLKGYKLSRALSKYKLLLILDNVENMEWSGFSNQIRSQIRALAEGIDASLRLVIAANKPLNCLFSDSSMVSPFENICLEEPILCWEEINISNFINYRLQDNPINFTKEEITMIISNSKGHPKRVMQLCNQTYARYLQ